MPRPADPPPPEHKSSKEPCNPESAVLFNSYITEISTPQYRATLTTAPQLLHTLGLVVGYFACYGTGNMTSSFSWRLPLTILAAYSAAFTAVALVVLPESPRWLTLRGRGNETAAVWDRLGVEPADREKIVGQLPAANSSSDGGSAVDEQSEAKIEEKQTPGRPGEVKKATDEPAQVTIMETLSDPNTRPQLLAGLFLMGMVQMSGIDGVLFVRCPFFLRPQFDVSFLFPGCANVGSSRPSMHLSSSSRQAYRQTKPASSRPGYQVWSSSPSRFPPPSGPIAGAGDPA